MLCVSASIDIPLVSSSASAYSIGLTIAPRRAFAQDIFGALDTHAKPGCLLATNTSTLSIDEIANATSRPEDVVGMHFFSPANVMPLLENVAGAKTSHRSIATAMKLGGRLRKKAVLARNCFGFIGNRKLAGKAGTGPQLSLRLVTTSPLPRPAGMLEPYLREALFLIEDGAGCKEVDRVLTQYGLAMGPFTMSDLAGIDIGYNIRKDNGWDEAWASERGQRYWGGLADALVERGRCGQKTKAGFYDYPEGRTPVESPEVEGLIADASAARGITRRPISEGEILDRSLLPLVNEGFKIVEEGIAQRESDLNIVYLYGYGFPRKSGGPMHWARHVREGGLPKVLADIREYQTRHPDVPHWAPSELLVAEADKQAAKAS